MGALASDPKNLFLTGDLGFMALEPVRDAFGDRFMNCGIAEQNMVTMAAALAREGFRPWVYSICPFIYARPFEQIRVDVCFHSLAVRLVGNGGGFGYGAQGPTHHAIEDCAVMSALHGMRVAAPVVAKDLTAVVEDLSRCDGPAYLRLGRDESAGLAIPDGYAPWRRLLAGKGAAILCVLGSLSCEGVRAALQLPESLRPDVWAVSELPVSMFPPPPEFLAALVEGVTLCIVEEHVANGGLGQQLIHHLALAGSLKGPVRHLHAGGDLPARYGSQAWYRRQVGIDADAMAQLLLQLS